MNNYATEYEYRQVNSRSILIDAEYQRRLDLNRVSKIVANFNPDLVNLVKVNRRDEGLYCFDGQHTLSALKKLFDKGSGALVECKVYLGQTKEWEAQMFSAQTGLSRKVETIDKLKALYIAKDIDVIEFYDVTQLTGIRMDFSRGKADNKIVACSTAYKIFKKAGSTEYIEIMGIIKEAWDGQAESFDNRILLGVAGFYTKYKGQFKRDALVRQLKRVSPVTIMRDADVYKTEGMNRYTNQVLRVYNKKLRGARILAQSG